MTKHHVTPKEEYRNVLLWLLFLTVATVMVARPVSGLNLGFLSTIVAMLIATVKASLVLAVFMGLRHDDRLHLGLVFAGVLFVVLLFAFSWVDIATRMNLQSPL